MAVQSFLVSPEVRNKTKVERWFFVGLAVAMMAVVVAGFAPSIVNTAGRRAPLSPLAVAHGVVFFAWLGIFLVQGSLVAAGNVGFHRRVGVAAVFVLVPMVVLGYATSVSMMRRGFDLSGDLRIERDPLAAGIFPLGDLLIFAILVTAAIIYRQRPEIHKRLMLFGNIALMPAPLAHFIGHWPRLAAMPPAIILVPISMFLMAAVAREYLPTGKVHPLTWGLAAAMLFSGPMRAFVIGPSAVWHRLASWLAR
jgi:hypothetical protein